MPSPKTHPWNAALYQLTRYKPAELKECAQNIHDLYLSRRGGSLQAVREKYKQHKVYDYLIDTAARDQTRERTNEFLESVKSHDLAKAEILNIINIRPTNIVEIPSLEELEELGSRSSGASNKEA
ncbi:uncharacterized protein [Arachis hypogaea]|uniref:RNA polymerase Rpb4/RPC9 core domain-containing protein n=1 Tax=Arachis hypogaea TaxID=3818 RepID=A0A445E9G5_ARAHY|nr:uncharacterized protein LOC112728288 [Arachis hypogaea]QHO25235.1 Putative cyclin [Arachis hypogaea]RYR72067.1 hypothetical protein Ahy_A02g006254 [Arachis hypogaea]